jgi:hypothetical protein
MVRQSNACAAAKVAQGTANQPSDRIGSARVRSKRRVTHHCDVAPWAILPARRSRGGRSLMLLLVGGEEAGSCDNRDLHLHWQKNSEADLRPAATPAPDPRELPVKKSPLTAPARSPRQTVRPPAGMAHTFSQQLDFDISSALEGLGSTGSRTDFVHGESPGIIRRRFVPAIAGDAGTRGGTRMKKILHRKPAVHRDQRLRKPAVRAARSGALRGPDQRP